MELEKQVCSLELAKRLKELGVKQESFAWWTQDKTPTNGNRHEYGIPQERMKWRVFPLQQSRFSGSEVFEEYSAFTVAELGEMLPKTVKYYRSEVTADVMQGRGSWPYYAEMWRPEGKTIVVNGDTEANARAKMLIYLIENNLLTPNNTK